MIKWPEPVDFSDAPEHAHVYGYTEAQLKQAVRDFGEQCLKECERLETEFHKAWKAKYDPNDQGKSDGATECLDAIRALVEEIE